MNRQLVRAGRAAVAATAGGSVFLASLAGTAALLLAKQVVTPATRTRDPIKVLKVVPDPGSDASGAITLERVTESEVAGEYTALWDHDRGRARISSIVTATLDTVTRRYDAAVGTSILEARSVRIASAPQRDVDDLGLPWENVEIPTELGPAPAWWLPARAGRPGDWIIHVHGRGATITEPLRTVPVAEARGWNSLVIRYRNDPDAPAGHRGTYGLGLTEWRDVDAAIEWARSRGAERILLAGWSMGGAIVAQTYLRSKLRALIHGIMLESPAMDWRSILVEQASQMRVPRPVASLGMWLLGSPLASKLLGVEEPINLDELDLVARADEFGVPILLLHSLGDTMVPIEASQRFAQARPDLVTFEEFTKARHTRLWNVDRETWERVVGDWLDARR